MNDIGGSTRDLHAVGTPHPAEDGLPAREREKTIRRLGTGWIIAGSSTLALSTVATLIVAVTADGALDSANGRLFASLGSMLVSSISGGLLVAGLIERLQQPQRTLIRRAAAVANKNAGVGAENAQMIDRTARLVDHLIIEVAGLRKDISVRLDAIEASVGALNLGMGQVAEHLPEALQLQNWRGFSDAVREGFGQKTGTDGVHRGRPPHLGLVTPKPDES